MTTLLTPVEPTLGGPSTAADLDVEPSNEWKKVTRDRIEEEMHADVERYRRERDEALRGAAERSPQWEAAMAAYNTNMHLMRMRAQEKYNNEVKEERYTRLIALGRVEESEDFEAFKRQQQQAMDQFKASQARRASMGSTAGPSSVRDGDDAEDGASTTTATTTAPPPPTAASPAAALTASGEHDTRDGAAMPHRDSRPLARAPPAPDAYRPRDRTQSGGSDQILAAGSYPARPGRSRGNSSTSAADFDRAANGSPYVYDQGSIGRQGLSSLSKTRPQQQDFWTPSPAQKDILPQTSRAYAHAASPISPDTPISENGRTISRQGSIRSKGRPSPVTDFDPFPRDRFGMGTLEERIFSRKGKEPDRTDHQRQPSFTQQTAVHDIFARRPDSRMTMPITPSRPTLASQNADDAYFPQVSPVNSRYPDDDGIRVRPVRRVTLSDQGSPENTRYIPPAPASARPIPSRKSSIHDFEWPSQHGSLGRPMYGPQSPPAVPTASSSRPIPRPSTSDEDARRHSPSGAWQGSQSPPGALPFAGYEIPSSSSPRYRHSPSPASSVSGSVGVGSVGGGSSVGVGGGGGGGGGRRRNSNGARSVRARGSRGEFWPGPSDVAQRPLPTYEEQSVASGSGSEAEDYGTDLDDLWAMRELQERRKLTWKLVQDEQRRQEMRRQAEAKRLEEEARKREEETRRQEEEVRMRAMEIMKKQEELARREAELLRREAEAKLQEERRKREEAEARLEEELRKRDEELRRREAEEAERRAREEEERRQREEKEEQEKREKEKREQEERDKREREEKLRRAKEERERRERAEKERREKEREEKERKQRERREKEEKERQERERQEREKKEREEWARQRKEEEDRFARERQEWEETRRREAEAAAAAATQARIEAARLAAESLAAAEALRRRQEEEARRREAEARRKREAEEEEERRQEEERQREEETQRQREAEEQRQREAEARRQREDEARQREEARKKEEAQRREEEARQREEARKRAEDEALRKRKLKEERKAAAEAARREREEEAKRQREQKLREAEAQRQRELDARRQREAEAELQRQREAEAQRQREAEARQREEEARAREAQTADDPLETDTLSDLQDPTFILEQEAELERIQYEREVREREAQKRAAEAAKQQEQAASDKEAQFRREQEELYKRFQSEEQGRQREFEARRRAQEEMQRKNQAAFQREDAILAEVLRRSEEEHRQAEERRRKEDRKRQDSVGSDSSRPYMPSTPSASSTTPRPIPNPGASFHHNPSLSGDRSSTASSSSYSSSASYFSAASNRSTSTGYTSSASTARAPATPTASATPTPGTPSVAKGWRPAPSTPSTPSAVPGRGSSNTYFSARTGSSSSYAQTPGAARTSNASYTPSSPLDEQEWSRRQEEHARRQFEQFQREQEAQQRRAEQKAIRQLSKEDVIRIFDEHEKRWARVQTMDGLSWHSFPWPMLKPPSDPEQLTYIEVQAYVLSPHQPGDKTDKERIKDLLRKWHPDRFETKVLPRVREDEREKVKEGAGSVARHLNKLLSSLSASAENGLFG